MKNHLRVPLFAVVWVSIAAGQEYAVTSQYGVGVKMRDGVTLSADIFRPKADAQFPVLLQRTPYNRAGEAPGATMLASHGYIVVTQDTRGRFGSGGEFYPFLNESLDGYDSVEWAAALPGSNGKVGMFGGSYVGATQMLAAVAKPPHLAAIFPYVTASEYYNGWTYQSGALMQWFTSSWSSLLATDTLRRKVEGKLDSKAWVQPLPLSSYRMLDQPAAPALTPYFQDWLKHESNDEYWRRWRISDHYAGMNIKALHAGGWHDIFLKGSIQNYTGMRAGSQARDGQRLLLGPWAHAETSNAGKIGDVVFGKAAVVDLDEVAWHWFDYALKGIQNEYATGAPVRLFVMGENVWRDEQEFPLKRARSESYYLDKGRLRPAAPAKQAPQEYDYDPANPVPTIGGRLCCGAQIPPGPADQRPNEGRPDVLVFSTEPLKTEVEVTGFIRLKLFASSSAADTDFTALLVDVDPSGYARFLTDGIVRARYRNSTEKAEALEPGKAYEFDIDLWATSNLFKAGHQIRLYVSSSNFPRFDRNLNTGEPIAGATRMVRAHQTIYHDAEHPSRLVLPVIPR